MPKRSISRSGDPEMVAKKLTDCYAIKNKRRRKVKTASFFVKFAIEIVPYKMEF